MRDWILLDALYRSRSLGLPKSGESMVPCLDLVNHSSKATAYFDENAKGGVSLHLNGGCMVPAGSEITIDYGRDKSPAEMLFSYGFIDEDSNARRLVLPLLPLQDDPLAVAKLRVFGTQPKLEISEDEDGNPCWAAPFAYLMCLNEEGKNSSMAIYPNPRPLGSGYTWSDFYRRNVNVGTHRWTTVQGTSGE